MVFFYPWFEFSDSIAKFAPVMKDFKTTEAAAKRLCNHLNREYKAPIVLTDDSTFEWREFGVVPYDRDLRKQFIVAYEANIHNTSPENLLQSFRDKQYTVSLILNTEPLSKVWIDMNVDTFAARTGTNLDLSPFE